MKRITGTVAKDLPHRFRECECAGPDAGELACGLCEVCGTSLHDRRHEVAGREVADEASLPRERAVDGD